MSHVGDTSDDSLEHNDHGNGSDFNNDDDGAFGSNNDDDDDNDNNDEHYSDSGSASQDQPCICRAPN